MLKTMLFRESCQVRVSTDYNKTSNYSTLKVFQYLRGVRKIRCPIWVRVPAVCIDLPPSAMKYDSQTYIGELRVPVSANQTRDVRDIAFTWKTSSSYITCAAYMS
jgi:hypothetical protein